MNLASAVNQLLDDLDISTEDTAFIGRQYMKGHQTIDALTPWPPVATTLPMSQLKDALAIRMSHARYTQQSELAELEVMVEQMEAMHHYWLNHITPEQCFHHLTGQLATAQHSSDIFDAMDIAIAGLNHVADTADAFAQAINSKIDAQCEEVKEALEALELIHLKLRHAALLHYPIDALCEQQQAWLEVLLDNVQLVVIRDPSNQVIRCFTLQGIELTASVEESLHWLRQEIRLQDSGSSSHLNGVVGGLVNIRTLVLPVIRERIKLLMQVFAEQCNRLWQQHTDGDWLLRLHAERLVRSPHVEVYHMAHISGLVAHLLQMMDDRHRFAPCLMVLAKKQTLGDYASDIIESQYQTLLTLESTLDEHLLLYENTAIVSKEQETISVQETLQSRFLYQLAYHLTKRSSETMICINNVFQETALDR